MKNKKHTTKTNVTNIGKWYLNNEMKKCQEIKDSKKKFLNK